MEIHEFLPLPSVFDSTPDPVRGFIYSALQLKALQQLYTEARSRSGKALSQNVLDTLQVEIEVSLRSPLARLTISPWATLTMGTVFRFFFVSI